MGMPALIDLKFNSFLGGLAVTFFFTLSGFLITNMLLTEKMTRGTIALRRFFVRRMLRIWPLYYLTLAAGYGLSLFWLRDIPVDVVQNGFILNLLFLPNLAFALGVIPEILIQIWSIGTEEQFYLIWPYLLKRTNPRKLVPLFAGIIGFFVVARVIVKMMGEEYDWLNILLFRTRIDCMAIGGLAALLLRDGVSGCFVSFNRLILRPSSGWLSAACFIGLLIVSYRFHLSLYQCYAVLSGILILRVIARPVNWLEYAVPRYLGKISYGIYLLHQFVIFFLFRELIGSSPIALAPVGSRLAGIGIFLLTVLLTAGLASISYFFFEKRFLRLKR
jgi:peptidoglycan/LPS O-acetylase OafA/YrhL